MIGIHARKGTGLDDLFKDYVPQRLEEIKRIESPYHFLAPVFQKYEHYLSYFNPNIAHSDAFLLDVKDVLTPSDIAVFLRGTIAYQSMDNHFGPTTAIFVTRLIQNSYNSGHNDFQLQLSSTAPLDYLLCGIIGTAQNPVRIVVDGNVGTGFAEYGQYLHCYVVGNTGKTCADNIKDSFMQITGNVGYFGNHAERSELRVYGNVGTIGFDAKDVRGYVTGNVEYICGNHAQGGHYHILGNVGFCGNRSMGTTFFVDKDVQECGTHSSGSFYSIGGNVLENCGFGPGGGIYLIGGSVLGHCGNHSQGALFVVGKDVGKESGQCSRRSIFIFRRNVPAGTGEHSFQSIFRVRDRETRESLI